MEAELVQVPIGNLKPNERNPRRSMATEELEGLADSIRQQGIVQPLVVVADGEPGQYLIVAGQRRHQAALKAGLDSVPCVIRELNPQQQVEIMLIENLQRTDLSPIEEALGYRGLVDQGLTPHAVAKRLGKVASQVYQALSLLMLPEQVQQMVDGRQLSAMGARALLKLPTAELQRTYAMRARIYGLSAARLGVLVDRYLAGHEQAEQARIALPIDKERRNGNTAKASEPGALLDEMAAKRGALPWPLVASAFRVHCAGCEMREDKLICQDCPVVALGRALLS